VTVFGSGVRHAWPRAPVGTRTRACHRHHVFGHLRRVREHSSHVGHAVAHSTQHGKGGTHAHTARVFKSRRQLGRDRISPPRDTGQGATMLSAPSHTSLSFTRTLHAFSNPRRATACAPRMLDILAAIQHAGRACVALTHHSRRQYSCNLLAPEHGSHPLL